MGTCKVKVKATGNSSFLPATKKATPAIIAKQQKRSVCLKLLTRSSRILNNNVSLKTFGSFSLLSLGQTFCGALSSSVELLLLGQTFCAELGGRRKAAFALAKPSVAHSATVNRCYRSGDIMGRFSAASYTPTVITLAALLGFRIAVLPRPALKDGHSAQLACCVARPHRMRWR